MMFGWPPFRWLMLAMAACAVYHTAGVYLDSCGQLLFWEHTVGSWRFVELPGDYKDQSFKIIAMVMGLQVTQTGLGILMRWLTK